MVSTAGGAGSEFSPQAHLLNVGGTVDTQLKKHSLARSASAATAHAGVWGNVISVAVRTRTVTSSLVRAHSCGDVARVVSGFPCWTQTDNPAIRRCKRASDRIVTTRAYLQVSALIRLLLAFIPLPAWFEGVRLDAMPPRTRWLTSVLSIRELTWG